MRTLLSVICLLFFSSCFAKTNNDTAKKLVKVKMITNYGDIILELNQEKAPITVKNFLQYTDKKFYDGTIFHRVIDGFMIQGGGLNENMQKKATFAKIKNEATNGLKNDIGTIAMARTNEVDSATSQFFINVNDNHSLNHRDKTPRGFGYTVFGKVTEGMSVVNRIKKVSTTSKNGRQNVPAQPIIIKKVERL